MKKTLITGLVITGLGLASIGTAFAYQGDPAKKGPFHNAEREAQINQIMASADYNAWKEFIDGRGRITQVITEENFTRFAESWKLAQEGKSDEAEAIREELGLKTKSQLNRLGMGMRQGMHKGKGAGFIDANNNGVCDNRE